MRGGVSTCVGEQVVKGRIVDGYIAGSASVSNIWNVLCKHWFLLYNLNCIILIFFSSIFIVRFWLLWFWARSVCVCAIKTRGGGVFPQRVCVGFAVGYVGVECSWRLGGGVGGCDHTHSWQLLRLAWHELNIFQVQTKFCCYLHINLRKYGNISKAI